MLPEYSTTTYCNYSKISVAIVIIEPHSNYRNHIEDATEVTIARVEITIIFMYGVYPHPLKFIYVHLYDY